MRGHYRACFPHSLNRKASIEGNRNFSNLMEDENHLHSIKLLPCYLSFHYPFHCLSGTACNHSMSLEMVPKVLLVVCIKTSGGEKKMQELEDEWMRKRATDEEKDREKDKGEKTGCHFSWARSFISVSFRAPPLIYFSSSQIKELQ